ncbi:hypothetical protein ABW19_dt0206051 [Dactylella cylindrospora]|nr:hypothetical protein ABW19_dt0206051 [Dactylella cylindrospora]
MRDITLLYSQPVDLDESSLPSGDSALAVTTALLLLGFAVGNLHGLATTVGNVGTLVLLDVARALASGTKVDKAISIDNKWSGTANVLNLRSWGTNSTVKGLSVASSVSSIAVGIRSTIVSCCSSGSGSSRCCSGGGGSSGSSGGSLGGISSSAATNLDTIVDAAVPGVSGSLVTSSQSLNLGLARSAEVLGGLVGLADVGKLVANSVGDNVRVQRFLLALLGEWVNRKESKLVCPSSRAAGNKVHRGIAESEIDITCSGATSCVSTRWLSSSSTSSSGGGSCGSCCGSCSSTTTTGHNRTTTVVGDSSKVSKAILG